MNARRPWATAALALGVLAVMAAYLTVRHDAARSDSGALWAQEDGEGRPSRRGQGGGQGPGGGPGMMGGGGGAMVALGDRLYVLQGPTLYKIDPAKMKIEAQLSLRAEGMGKPPGGGEDGNRPPPPEDD